MSNEDIARLEGEVSEQEELVFQVDKVGFPVFRHARDVLVLQSHPEQCFVYFTGFGTGTSVTTWQGSRMMRHHGMQCKACCSVRREPSD